MSRRAVAEALDWAIAAHGKPRSITVDHDTEFTSRVLDEWAYQGAESGLAGGFCGLRDKRTYEEILVGADRHDGVADDSLGCFGGGRAPSVGPHLERDGFRPSRSRT